MTKDEIDELVAKYYPGMAIPTCRDRNCHRTPHCFIYAKDAAYLAQALRDRQADLDETKEILKALGKISVPVELYRLSVVAKRAKNLLEKMEKR